MGKHSWEALSQAAARAYPKTDAQALVALLQFRGAPLPLAAPAKISSGLDKHESHVGLVATRPISRGETILEVPHACWYPHSARAALAAANQQVGPSFQTAMAKLDAALLKRGEQKNGTVSMAPLAALTMQVLFQAVPGPDGAYLKWLHAAHPLEAVARAMPSFWGKEKLAELQASDLVAGSNNTPLSRLPSLAHALHGALFGASTNPAATSAAAPPPALVLWALSLVQSRATSGPGGCSGSAGRGGGGSTGGMPFSMVPYFDLLNHCPRGCHNAVQSYQPHTDQEEHISSSSSEGRGGRYLVHATADIPAGEECLISYGNLPNSELLRLYGFAGENNPWDFARLQLDLSALQHTTQSSSNQNNNRNGVAPDSAATAREAMGSFVEAADSLHEDSLRVSVLNPLPPSLLDLSTKAAAAGLLDGFIDESGSSGNSRSSGSGTGDGDLGSFRRAPGAAAGRHWLARSAAAQLASYGTSIAEDELMLQRHDEAVIASAQSSPSSKRDATNRQKAAQNSSSTPAASSSLSSPPRDEDVLLPAWQRSCILVRLGEKIALAAVAAAADSEKAECASEYN